MMKRLLSHGAAAAALLLAGTAHALPVQVTTSLELSGAAQQVIAGQLRPFLQLDKYGSGGAPFVDVVGQGQISGYAPSFFHSLGSTLPTGANLRIMAFLSELQIDSLALDADQQAVTAHVSSLNRVGFPSGGTSLALFTTTAVAADPYPAGLDLDNSQAPVPGTTFQAGTVDLYFTDAFRQLIGFYDWEQNGNLETLNSLSPGAYAVLNGEVSVGRLTWTAVAVPEPSTWALVGLGLAAAAGGARRRRGRE